MKKNKAIFYVVFTLITYLVLYATYYFTSEGLPYKAIFLQSRRYIPCALAVTLGFYLWKKAIPKGLPLAHFLVSLAYITVFPILYWLTYHAGMSFIDKHYDEAFGAYFFAAITCLHLLLLSLGEKSNKISCFFLSILDLLILIIPLFQLVYWQFFQTSVTEAGIMAILQTNYLEAKEYILQNLGYSGIAGVIIVLLVILYLLYKEISRHSITNPLSKKHLAIACILMVVVGSYDIKNFKETGVPNIYKNTKGYFEASNKFTQYHKNVIDSLVVTPDKPPFAKPSTIIMVIGESASRDFMSAYVNTPQDTTPWMREMSQKPDFVLFKNAYTSWQQTVPALERALTEKNQYNAKEFNQTSTVIDIARKAGYKTYWFSNQGTYGDADTPITLVAKTADKSIWLEDSIKNATTKIEYDTNLLPFLKEVNPNENNFIIFHIMGSHDNFINRYPPEFTRWGEPNVQDVTLNYDNSLAFTDYFLKEVFDYSQEHLNLQFLLYFSDHGNDPNWKRHPDQATFTGLRIPMFLYLSPEYQSLNPLAAKTLKEHSATYFTNDLMYETFCGILNIKSNRYDETESLASPSYKFTKETLRTGLGKIKLTDDPK